MANKIPNSVIITLAGLVLAATAYLWGRQSAPQAIAAVSNDEKRLATLERELRGLQAATKKATLVSHQAGAQGGNVDVDPDVPRGVDEPAAQAPEVLDPEEEAKRGADLRAEYLAGLDQRLSTEAVDVPWRREKEAAIHQLIPEHMGAGVSVTEASCGSSVCRVKLNHAQWPRLPQDKVSQFVVNRGALEGLEIQFDISTTGATTLYFLRDQPAFAAQ